MIFPDIKNLSSSKNFLARNVLLYSTEWPSDQLSNYQSQQALYSRESEFQIVKPKKHLKCWHICFFAVYLMTLFIDWSVDMVLTTEITF
jgi:hypothetical protein